MFHCAQGAPPRNDLTAAQYHDEFYRITSRQPESRRRLPSLSDGILGLLNWCRRDGTFNFITPSEKNPVLTIGGRDRRFGNGTNRREFLRVGALGVAGLTLADLLRADARGGTERRAKSVIYVVLGGGPSHIDMYDLKPDAPAEYRGPFKPIPTRLTGVPICELMPPPAGVMNQPALLRGRRSVENDHFFSG